MARHLMPVVACVLSVAVFFRVQLRTGFGIVFGDRTDGLIEITILEHWWNVVRLRSAWADTLFFHPVGGALGYNDGYLIFGLVYSCFRLAGCDQLLSSDLTSMTVKAVGFCGAYTLLSRHLRLPALVAALGASLFTISNSSYANAYHAQLFSVAFLPALIVLCAEMLRSIRRGSPRGALLWGAGSAALYCCWLLTALYTAWFSAYLALFLVPLLVLRLTREDRRIWRAGLRRTAPALAAVAVVALAGLWPFVLLYGPKAAETGMHPFSEVLQYAPSPMDLFNVGPHNVVFGRLDAALSARAGSGFPPAGEHVMGMPPVLVLLALAGAVPGIRGAGPGRRLWPAVAAASLASWLCTVHVGQATPWRLFYDHLPGAKAVRVISRYEIVLDLPVVLLAMQAVARGVAHRPGSPRKHLRTALCLLLATSLVAEELNASWPLGLVRPAEPDRPARIPPPPERCKAFYAVGTRSGAPLPSASVDATYSNNVDAMFIAESIGVPTLNGMASFYPRGWDLTRPASPDYLARVGAWAGSKGVHTVCGLDLGTLDWVR